MTLHYERCNKEDIQPIYNVLKQHILRFEDPNNMDLQHALKLTLTSIEANYPAMIKVIEDQEIIGYYGLFQNQDFSWQLKDFIILPNYRHQGYGTTILNQILTEVDDTLYITLFSRNTSTIDFFEAHDFIIHKILSRSQMILKHTDLS